PFDGEVRIEEQDARRLGRRALARLVAFVPQKPETPPELTVAEYVLLGRTPHISYLGGEGKRDRDAAARALRRLDLEKFAQRARRRTSSPRRTSPRTTGRTSASSRTSTASSSCPFGASRVR